MQIYALNISKYVPTCVLNLSVFLWNTFFYNNTFLPTHVLENLGSAGIK